MGLNSNPETRKKNLFFFFHKKRLEGKFELVSLTLMLDIILEHSSIESWERQQTTGLWKIRNLMTSLYSLEKRNLEGMEVSVSLWGSASGSPGKGIQRVEWGSQRVHGAAGRQGQEPGKLQVARQSWELYSRSNLLRKRKPDVFYSKTSWYTSGFLACLFVWSLGRRELFTQTAFISGVCK